MASAPLGPFGDPAARLDGQPQCVGEGRHRLHASHVRTAHHPLDRVVAEEIGQPRGLGRALVGQGSEPVVVVPVGSFAGVGVAHEVDGHVETLVSGRDPDRGTSM